MQNNLPEAEYLSDEELNELIKEVEESAMLTAPSYLREEILKQIQVSQPKKSNRQELFFYSLKVGFATAAAVAMLFVLPMGSRPTDGYDIPTDKCQGFNKVSEKINEKTNWICEQIYSISNEMIQ